jgi:hypothetical protein
MRQLAHLIPDGRADRQTVVAQLPRLENGLAGQAGIPLARNLILVWNKVRPLPLYPDLAPSVRCVVFLC